MNPSNVKSVNQKPMRKTPTSSEEFDGQIGAVLRQLVVLELAAQSMAASAINRLSNESRSSRNIHLVHSSWKEGSDIVKRQLDRIESELDKALLGVDHSR